MIVHCEGCESGFHVDEHLIKPTGSKLRCSKCRHVFTAYPPAPPAPADEAEEPLILSDALPAAETNTGPAKTSGIESKIDEVFGEAGGEEPELLSVEDLLADEPPPKEALTVNEIGADLDLDLSPAAAAEEGDTLPGLDELEIDLAMLEGAAEKAEAVPGKGTPQAEPELDLDLESLALEGSESGGVASDVAGLKHAPEAAREATVQAADSSSELLDALKLDLEMADAKTTTLLKGTGESAKSSDSDEIDISDLEDMLDGEGPALAATVETDLAVRDDGLDLQLDIEPETGPDQEEVSVGASDQEEASVEASAEADELDFSDISAMLEQEKKPIAAAAGEALEDVDLAIEDTPATVGSDEDLMLDLEKLLDEGHGTASTGKQEEAPDELDLDIVPEEVQGSGTELEVELEVEPAATPAVKRLPVAAVAQTPVAAAARAAVAATDNFSTDEFTSAGATGATSVLEPAPVAESIANKKPVAFKHRRAGSRKPLLAVLGVLVLCVAALTLPRSLGINIPFLSDLQIPYLSEMDIEIPFIGNIFKSEPEDSSGGLKLALVKESMAAEFVANPSAGLLCVVKGQVRNSYNQPRSGMRVTVKLYKAGNAVVKTATVFAGNVLSNQELSSLDLIAINARLKNSTGANNMNVGVKPGRSVPFMAVFSNLPDGVDEYSVEVAGSTP